MAACPVAATARCLVKNVDGRPHMYLPRAEKVIAGFSVELLEIGGIKLAIEVLPSRGALQLERKTSVKVLQGKIRWTEGSQEKVSQERPLLLLT